jgi:hypothetical protein
MTEGSEGCWVINTLGVWSWSIYEKKKFHHSIDSTKMRNMKNMWKQRAFTKKFFFSEIIFFIVLQNQISPFPLHRTLLCQRISDPSSILPLHTPWFNFLRNFFGASNKSNKSTESGFSTIILPKERQSMNLRLFSFPIYFVFTASPTNPYVYLSMWTWFLQMRWIFTLSKSQTPSFSQHNMNPSAIPFLSIRLF